MLQFAWPWIAAALALPWLVARSAPPAAPLAIPLRVPFLREAKVWSRAGGAARMRAALWLALAAWVALVVAATRPQWIGEPIGAPVSARNVLLALDVSASMRAASRDARIGLEVMRATAKAFVARRAGDRIGLIVFGSKAYLQSPLTVDRHAVAAMIDEAFIGLAGEGTALGDAIALGVAKLRAMSREQRVLILLTDGESTQGVMTVGDAVRLARHHGVRVYAIGIGERAAARPGEGLNARALADIAETTGGRFFHAREAAALERIYAALDRVEPVVRDERRLRPTTELYPWPLGAALALALAAALGALLPRRARRAAR